MDYYEKQGVLALAHGTACWIGLMYSRKLPLRYIILICIYNFNISLFTKTAAFL